MWLFFRYSGKAAHNRAKTPFEIQKVIDEQTARNGRHRSRIWVRSPETRTYLSVRYQNWGTWILAPAHQLISTEGNKKNSNITGHWPRLKSSLYLPKRPEIHIKVSKGSKTPDSPPTPQAKCINKSWKETAKHSSQPKLTLSTRAEPLFATKPFGFLRVIRGKGLIAICQLTRISCSLVVESCSAYLGLYRS